MSAAPFAIVKPSALTAEAQAVLNAAPTAWHQLPRAAASIARELEVFGLVQIREHFLRSRTDPGAGRHVTQWRRKPAAGSAA